MTITLEPLVRHSAVHGKEAIVHTRSVPPPPPQTTRSDQPLNSSPARSTNLLRTFIEGFKEVDSYRCVRRDRLCCRHVLKLPCRNGSSILIDGYNLSVPAVTAAARYNAPVTLDDSTGVRERLQQSRDVIIAKMDAGKSVYGVSTGYGGSGECRPLTLNDSLWRVADPITPSAADTRTDDPLRLGSALLQHQHAGVISTEEGDSLPLLDPLSHTSMPESWVRGAILIRMNSLIRGHSGVRVELIHQMSHLLREHITPLVPLRGSISASGGEHFDSTLAPRSISYAPSMFRSVAALIHCRYLDRQPFNPHNLSIHFVQNSSDPPVKQGARPT